MTKGKEINEIVNTEGLIEPIRRAVYNILEHNVSNPSMILELIPSKYGIDIPKMANEMFGEDSLNPCSPTYFDDFKTTEWFYNEKFKKVFAGIFPEWIEVFFGYNQIFWSYGINVKIKSMKKENATGQ